VGVWPLGPRVCITNTGRVWHRMASHTLPVSSSPSPHHRMMSQVANPTATKLGRSSSRMSSASRGSSEEDQSKTAVRVGTHTPFFSKSQICLENYSNCVFLGIAIRVRPPLEPGQPGYELVPQRFQRSIVQVTNNTSLVVESPQGKRNFVFDRVFNENVGQEGVMEWLKESIESFVMGYNVSLLAYGQSGAGKSYTMGTSGPTEQNDPWQMGLCISKSCIDE